MLCVFAHKSAQAHKYMYYVYSVTCNLLLQDLQHLRPKPPTHMLRSNLVKS